ncbi:S-layer family protein [Candidatus Obscuribacterales bacterium]|nr:S-layer family protein [Candidatus Obscuribacterales bacterium]
MSKKIVRDRVSFSKNWAAVIAGSLMVASTQQSHAANENSFRAFRDQNPNLDRATQRQMFREQRGIERTQNLGIQTPALNVPTNALPSVDSSSRAVRQLERRLENNGSRNQTFQALDGQLVRVNKGIDLDLTSNTRNITLGSNLFNNASAITINVGGHEKTVSAGDQVSAAEYVAVKQLISGGGQKVTLDAQGRATGGDVDLSVLTNGNDTMRASDLVVPVNVTAIGDFGRGSDFRLLGDLTNSGTVHALTTGVRKNSGGALRADDIINNSGALIQSDVSNLLVDASGNFVNAGTISANGNITLQAGGSLTNSGSVSASGDVGINSNNVTNTGTIASTKGNVNFDGADTAALNINNAGGTVSAERGAINFRTESYTGVFDNNISGGDFLSKEFNTHAGQATNYVNVNQLTGVLNQTGAAAHVQAATDNLEIGTVCLTGDPTYRNSAGSITVSGDLTVSEALTIIAEGDITVLNGVHITAGGFASGYDVTLIAGADITGVDGGANIPSIPPGITGSVTINGNASATGGSVLFGANTTLSTRGTAPGTPANGGNVALYAFEGNTAGSGRVDASNVLIRVGGQVNGLDGSVTIIAGANSGDAIKVGPIETVGGGYTSGSTVAIINAQPISSGGSITWGPNGQRTTTSNLIASADVANGNVVFSGDVQVDDALVVTTGGNISFLGNISLSANIAVLAAGGSLIGNAQSQVGATDLYLFAHNDIGASGNLFITQANNLNISSDGSAYIHNELGLTTLTNGPQLVAGNFVLDSSGSINVGSSIVATNVSLIAGDVGPGSITFDFAGQINATGNVSLTAQNDLTVGSNTTITGTELTLAFTTGSTDLKTNVDGLTVTSGNNLSVHNAKTLTIHDVTVANSFSADTTATGNLIVDGDVVGTTVNLTNANGNITLDGDINGATVNLSAFGGSGAIEQNSGVVSAGGLSIVAGAGGVGNNGALKYIANTINVNSATTGANVSLAYIGTLPTNFIGANDIFGNFSLEAKQASVVGFGAGSSLSATGSVFINAGSIDLSDRSVSGNGGITFKGDTDLVVTGAASPGAGLSTTGGNSIEFIAGNGNLTTNGFLNFVGGDAKMTLQNNNGTNSFTNSVGATLNGDTTNDLIITAQVYNANGTVQNFANTIIVNGNTIANSNGDVVLPSNLIFSGQNLAIIASGNITGTLTQINLGSTTTGGGNLTILAGVAFTPATLGQVQSAQPFTITTASSSGGRIDLGSTDIITSSTLGNGGNVVLAAFAGSDQSLSTISVGNIDTVAASGFTSGSIRILGPGAITTGSLNTGAPSKGGVIDVQAARAGNTGNIVVTDGTVTGLENLIADSFAAGSISTGTLSAQTANLTSTTGAIAVNGTGGGLTNLNVTTTSGNFTLTGTANSVTNTTFTSGSGNFTVAGQNFQNLTSNSTSGTVSLTNNFVDIIVLGATGTAQNLTLSTAGVARVNINGAVNLGTGNLTATSGGSGAEAIKVSAPITANDISLTSTLTALNGGITLNDDITGTGTITLSSQGTIDQLSGKVINGGNLIVSEVTSATAGLALAVDSLQVNNATDFKFTQTGDLELRGLTANSVTGTVTTGNVTTGADITVPTLDLTVDGAVSVLNAITASTEAKITAKNNITTAGSGLIATPKLTLTSNTGSVGTVGTLLAINTPDLTISAPTGNVFVSNANATNTDLFGLTTTGTVRIETVGTLENIGGITGSTVTLKAAGFDLLGAVNATTLIDINQTAGNITLSEFSGGLNGTALRLNATAGSVGTSATPFAAVAGFNTISAFGTSVYVTSANTAGVTLSGGLANGAVGSGDFEFRTTGPLTVSGNVESTNGAILLQNTAGLLQIGAGITILGDTAINIRNTGSVDEVDLIAIGANATIRTDTTTKGNGAGQINIVQGVPKDGKVRRNIKNVVQNLQGGGEITFGGSKASYIAQAPDNTFNAIGANIYFSTDQSKKDGGLTFGGGVTITADPPVPAGSATITYGVRNAAPTTLELNATQPVNADTANIANVSLVNAVNAPAVTFNQAQNSIANSLLNIATNDARLPGLVSDSSDNSYIVSTQPSTFEVDAPVCSDMNIAITGCAAGTAGTKGIATMPHSEIVTLNNGNALFVPSKDTTVVTPKGTVKIAANSVAMVMVDENQLSVYDINDHHKRSVTIEAGGRSIALSPGRHVSIASVRAAQFSDVNPLEAMMHRSVSSQEIGDKTAFTSEFSMPAAVQVMKPLKAIFASDNENAKKVAQRVLKTSAVIMQVSGNAAPFEHHVRARRVAFN